MNLTALLTENKPLPNNAFKSVSTETSQQIVDQLFESNGTPKKDAYERAASYLRIKGGFNVNSVSIEGWSHFLSGLLSRSQVFLPSVTGQEPSAIITPDSKDGKFLITRYNLANAEPAERATGKEKEDRYWNGSREVSADQIKELARAIVPQFKQRDPFRSMAEFVNRRISTDKKLAVSGALQSALDDSTVTINAPFRSELIKGTETSSAGKPVYNFPEAAQGSRKQGITGYVTQADLLASVGTSLSVRSDTFTIRAMGEARDGTGKLQSRAWCEAVVQRTAAYVNPSEDPVTAFGNLTKAENIKFGRRFEIVSFRWVPANEIQ